MLKKETKDRIKLACWDASVLIVTGIYIGIVVHFMNNFYNEENSFNFWSLIGAVISSFFILWVMSYCNRWVKKRFERSEDWREVLSLLEHCFDHTEIGLIKMMKTQKKSLTLQDRSFFRLLEKERCPRIASTSFVNSSYRTKVSCRKWGS